MNDGRWIRVTAVSNVPAREGRAVSIGAREIAIFNLGDRFLAIDNRCPHRGGPLADGLLAGTSVVCPLHAWRVDLDNGRVIRPASDSCIRTYPIRLEHGVLLIELPRATQGEAACASRTACQLPCS
jgi:nitrite reductase (NADH) small subunit